MDGTLFDHSRREVSKETIKALQELKANGIKIAIATGRPYEMLLALQKEINQIDFDYLITSNGQSIYENGKLVYRNFLDKEDVRTIIKIANENDLALNLVGDNINISSKMNDKLVYSCEIIGFACPTVEKLSEDFDGNVDHAVCYEEVKYKKLFEPYLKKSVVTYWSQEVFEFTPNNGVKVHGIKKVLDQLDLKLENAIAFGDGENDREMLKEVGFGVAMGNASDYVKEFADYITDDVREDGVMKALKRIKLI